MPRKITTIRCAYARFWSIWWQCREVYGARQSYDPGAAARSAAPGYIRVEVRDTGVGIPQEKLRHIFTAFNQEHRHLSQKYGGTGLGLTICQRLIELLHGRIHAQSELGKGSCLAFELPITTDEAAQLAVSAEMIRTDQLQIRQHESSIIQIPLRILVAEDTRSIQFLIRRMLEDIKSKVTLVNNGQEALDLLLKYSPGTEPYDLISDGHANARHERL